jgi:hypothetical protein
MLNISGIVDVVEAISMFLQIFNSRLKDWSPTQSDDLRYNLI